MGDSIVLSATNSKLAGCRPCIPSLLRCGLLLAGVKLALEAKGFGPTWRWIRRRTDGTALVDDVSAVLVTVTEYRLATAAALYPGRALCLEQSLALYYLLRRAGVGVEFRIGVQMYPFLAHAWVEYRGQPLNDVPEHVKQFAPFDEASL